MKAKRQKKPLLASQVDQMATALWCAGLRLSPITNQPQHFRAMEKTKRDQFRRMARVALMSRWEPACIKCGCTWDNACDEGCSWTFLNKKTNEGLCSACFEQLYNVGWAAGLKRR